MDPEQQHLEFIKQQQKNIVKGADCMARVRYTVYNHILNWNGINFEVYIQIWQDKDWNYKEFLEFCKKLTDEKVELNTNSYKVMADELYLLIANEMPGRNIWICINHNDNDIGITIKYEK